MKNLSLLMSASIVVLGFAVAAPALAQEQQAPTGERSARPMDVITVTAQKREQDIQDVALSVTAITGAVIEDSGINDLVDLSLLVPNFQVNESTPVIGGRINIRGVSSSSNDAIEPSVGIFIDGAYVPRPGAIVGNLFDIEQVEVLRGPQGTLFGRNTPIGALNITTRQPESEFGGSFAADASSFGSYGANGHLTGAITPNLLGRIALNYDMLGAYVENSFDNEDENSRENFGVRGRFIWQALPSVSADLVVDYQRVNNTGGHVELLSNTVTDTFLDRFETVFGTRIDNEDTFDYKINHIHTDMSVIQQWGATLTVETDIGSHSLTSVTAYRDWEDDLGPEEVVRLPANILNRDRISQSTNYSQEFRIASDEDRTVSYIGGLFFYREDYKIDTYFSAGPDYCNNLLPSIGRAALVAECNAAPNDAVVDLFSQDLASIAVFGQATYNITDQFSLTGGLRWTRDEKTNGEFIRTVPNAAFFFSLPEEATTGLEIKADSVTWLANARYFVLEDTMVFATVSTGYKSGGFNSSPGASERVFEEETSTSYEVGVKSTLFNGLMTANATLFRTDVTDFQERLFTGLTFIVDNAGSVRQQGIELDVRARPLEQLDLLLGASFLDSEFTDYDGAPGLPGGPPQDLTGRTRPESPEWQASFVGSWTDQIPNTSLEWFVRGEYQFVDDQIYGPDLDPQSEQPAYGLTNFRIGLSDSGAGWKIDAFVRNAFETEYCGRIFAQVFGGFFGAVDRAANTSAMRCVVGRPRTFGVRASTQF